MKVGVELAVAVAVLVSVGGTSVEMGVAGIGVAVRVGGTAVAVWVKGGGGIVAVCVGGLVAVGTPPSPSSVQADRAAASAMIIQIVPRLIVPLASEDCSRVTARRQMSATLHDRR
ncbi:MAG TPA: hypothetical protein VLU24_06690, partial [Mycobacterium sp.]|nr:hypothetical protein [Mycobacterium sp.]